jgi:glutathione peroxidase-family protein
VSFDKYKGKVVLVTNVACYCGLTNSNYKVTTPRTEQCLMPAYVHTRFMQW